MLRKTIRKIWLNTGQSQGIQMDFSPYTKARVTSHMVPGNIKHPGGIAQSQHVPGQFVSPKHVSSFIALGSFFHYQSDDNGRGQVGQDDKDVE